jgi:glutamyl-Q tRNA(Asp) synthetase
MGQLHSHFDPISPTPLPPSLLVNSAPYIGRFAPSPTGPLHAGSLVAALGSWLDARAHGGRWLLRMEDLDPPRCAPKWAQHIEWQLQTLGLHSDAPVCYQSTRSTAYAAALTQLEGAGLAYPCICSRSQIAQAGLGNGSSRPRFGDLVYPNTCRPCTAGATSTSQTQTKQAAWRFALPRHLPELTHWHDRALGAQSQHLRQSVGDFVLRRADGLWAYQLAVVVDDASQGVTHVVRGQDLADNTARQIALQQALDLPTPQYLHLPLVRAADGHKLSKQNGAQALNLSSGAAVLQTLNAAAGVLQLPATTAPTAEDALSFWAKVWGKDAPILIHQFGH